MNLHEQYDYMYNVLQDGLDDSPDLLAEDPDHRGQRSVSVDLTDNSLVVDISDALSEKDKVKFTVHTKVCQNDEICFVFHCAYCQTI